MTYSYDPRKIRCGGKDQMRFELGDTAVSGGAEVCALSDEEYFSFLGKETKGSQVKKWTKRQWLLVKVDLVEAILYRLSFQVDTKIDSLSYDFSARTAQWQILYEGLKKEVETLSGLPVLVGSGKKRDYFYSGMQENRENRVDVI